MPLSTLLSNQTPNITWATTSKVSRQPHSKDLKTRHGIGWDGGALTDLGSLENQWHSKVAWRTGFENWLGGISWRIWLEDFSCRVGVGTQLGNMILKIIES